MLLAICRRIFSPAGVVLAVVFLCAPVCGHTPLKVRLRSEPKKTHKIAEMVSQLPAQTEQQKILSLLVHLFSNYGLGLNMEFPFFAY